MALSTSPNWKQRFFVPTDKTSGIDVLESLLERYPITLTEDAVTDSESGIAEAAPRIEIRATEIVDLDEWFVAVETANPEEETADESKLQVEAARQEAATEKAEPFTLTPEAAVSWTHFRQSEQTQLAFSFG